MPEPLAEAPQAEIAPPGTPEESAPTGLIAAASSTASAQAEPKRRWGVALLWSVGVGLALAVIVSAFGAGWRVGSDSRPASLQLVELRAPRWIAEFARAFCSGDAAFVAAQVAGETGVTEDGVRDAFARWEWQCDQVRYLGSSAGKQQTAYIFVMRSGTSGPETWWTFTTENEKVVRID